MWLPESEDTEMKTQGEGPKFGDTVAIAQRAEMYVTGFQDDVYGVGAASFIAEFCKNNMSRAHNLSRKAQAECKDNEAALVHLAGKVKYIIAHLELAACYGKQIGIVSENEVFRAHALTYIAVVYAELEALEHFIPEQAAA